MPMIQITDEQRKEYDQQFPDGWDSLVIPVPKGTYKDDIGSVEVCLQAIPRDSYQEILIKGLASILVRGMSDIKDKENPKNRALAMEQAQKNLKDVYTSKIRMSKGVRAKGMSGEIKTQAMRDAREIIKAHIKAKGLKVTSYKASEISAEAQNLLDGEYGPEIIAAAKATVEARHKEQGKIKVDLSIQPDPALVAKAEAKAKRSKKPKADKVPLGEVMQRAKPAQATAH